MIGFIIWSAVALMLFVIAVLDWRSKKPVGFYSGVKAPEVRDVRKYNRAVALLWLGYAVLFELLGIPLLFLRQNKALITVTLLGVMFITVGLLIGYQAILRRMKKTKEETP